MAYSLLSIGIDDFEDHQEYATSFSLHTQLIVITPIDERQLLPAGAGIDLKEEGLVAGTDGPEAEGHGPFFSLLAG